MGEQGLMPFLRLGKTQLKGWLFLPQFYCWQGKSFKYVISGQLYFA